jgi:hypothetical protein
MDSDSGPGTPSSRSFPRLITTPRSLRGQYYPVAAATVTVTVPVAVTVPTLGPSLDDGPPGRS